MESNRPSPTGEFRGRPRHRGAGYASAIITTILWSSSYVLIKWGLSDIPPLYFATLRYVLAFFILLVLDLVFAKQGRGGSGRVGRAQAGLLIIAGLAGYSLAQGLQYVGLYYLPAVTTSFLLNFTPFFVLVLGVATLREGASTRQLGGLGLALIGAWVFFSERAAWNGQIFGVVVVIISGLGWGTYVVTVRFLHRSASISSLHLTTITMGIGACGMAVMTALSGQYAPLTGSGILTIVWLATANTALAFFLWNWSLKAIPAYELTVLQDLMLVEISIFAFVFLQEAITPLMIVGMALVLGGVLVVQVRGRLSGVRE